MLRVLLVHPHAIVRAGLKEILSEEYRAVGFGHAQTLDEASVQLDKHPWDVAVVDISFAGRERFHLLQETVRRRPSTRILALSGDSDSYYAARALQMGATGCVSRNANRSDLIKAFRSVAAGKPHLDLSTPNPSRGQTKMTGQTATLSPREHKVLLALAAGKRSGEIASDANLSVKTVSTYKRRILDKLGLKSTADLVRHVIKEGLK